MNEYALSLISKRTQCARRVDMGGVIKANAERAASLYS